MEAGFFILKAEEGTIALFALDEEGGAEEEEGGRVQEDACADGDAFEDIL